MVIIQIVAELQSAYSLQKNIKRFKIEILYMIENIRIVENNNKPYKQIILKLNQLEEKCFINRQGDIPPNNILLYNMINHYTNSDHVLTNITIEKCIEKAKECEGDPRVFRNYKYKLYYEWCLENNHLDEVYRESGITRLYKKS